MASVFAHASRLTFSLDPLIAEAKRRMRRRRFLVAAVVVAIAGGAGGAAGALHGNGGTSGASGRQVYPERSRAASSAAARSISVDVFGQPSGSAEVSGPPFREALAVLRSNRLAASLPASHGPMSSLSSVASHMRGKPGSLVPSETRQVATALGPIYLVPTTRGWLCMQGPSFQTCHRGLLRQGVTWNFYSTQTGVDVVGVAADDVTAVTLTYGKTRRKAALHDNVFFVQRPMSFTSVDDLPPIGTLEISYRGGKPPTSVPIN